VRYDPNMKYDVGAAPQHMHLLWGDRRIAAMKYWSETAIGHIINTEDLKSEELQGWIAELHDVCELMEARWREMPPDFLESANRLHKIHRRAARFLEEFEEMLDNFFWSVP